MSEMKFGGVSAASGDNPPGVVNGLIAFTVGDAQPGSPVDGQTSLKLASLQGNSLVNVTLLVLRESSPLIYSTPFGSSAPTIINDIRRYNDGTLGGFTFEVASGLKFFAGERYQIFITAVNTTIQT